MPVCLMKILNFALEKTSYITQTHRLEFTSAIFFSLSYILTELEFICFINVKKHTFYTVFRISIHISTYVNATLCIDLKLPSGSFLYRFIDSTSLKISS